jgi:peptidylprolyl isomerase
MLPTKGILITLAVVLVGGGLYSIFRSPPEPDPIVPDPVVVTPEAPVDGVDLGLRIKIAGEANGTIVIDLLEDVAPGHAAQLAALAREGAYDGVVFHRVIDGFMAQTGDVEFGRAGVDGFDMRRAGMGGSSLPDLGAEFSDIPFERGIVGMVLNNQYTVVGRVTDGMDVVDAIKRGDQRANGAVTGEPDRMVTVTVTAE